MITLFMETEKNVQPYPGDLGGVHVACTVFYVYRKVSAGLAWSVALQLQLIVCSLSTPRLVTLGVWNKLTTDRSPPY